MTDPSLASAVSPAQHRAIKEQIHQHLSEQGVFAQLKTIVSSVLGRADEEPAGGGDPNESPYECSPRTPSAPAAWSCAVTAFSSSSAPAAGAMSAAHLPRT